MKLRSTLGARRFRWAAGGIALSGVLLAMVVAAFPFGSLKATIEHRLSKRFGRPVTIGRIDRLDRFSFTPTIVMRDVRVPQPAWAGRGDLARVASAQVRFSIWPLLSGRFAPESIEMRGMRLALVRAANGRENWRKDGPSGGGGSGPRLRGLRVSHSFVSYVDQKRGRSFAVEIVADTATGLRVTGSGQVRGAPVKVSMTGGAIERGDAPWPFTAALDGPKLAMSAKGTMDTPLDLGNMTLDMTARADDLKLIDGVIEAGLIGTQPVRLGAHIRHADSTWTITNLAGRIGRSPLAGRLTVRKEDGRTKLDGDVVFDALAFDDLSSNEGRAVAIAKERAAGPRLVPDTRVNIRKITMTDGILRFEAKRLLGGTRPSSFTSMKGTLVLDRQLLTIAPFSMGMNQGAIGGTVVVDQRGGRPVPIVHIDLRLRGSSVAAVAGGGGATVSGKLEARARLTGVGSTLREVVGRSNGHIGLVARDGTLPARVAALMGFDVARGLLAKDDARAGLRCLVLRLNVRGGIGRADPMIVDTTQSQSRGQGTISFPSETIALTLTGAPKQRSILRLPGSALMGGTIRDPKVTVPPEIKSAGNIFKAIGRSIAGKQGPLATDANCPALAAQALSGD